MSFGKLVIYATLLRMFDLSIYIIDDSCVFFI